MGTPDPALAKVIDQLDDARARRTPLDIRGGGTKYFYGGPTQGRPLE